ncbi:SgcJ/EcaC family oxidoreductase [Alkalihalobacillus hwajinpoensis]|uniref:SgcJ/EcaC family oxidoreductase n=1 Tax=Guptibacillus hwajinpoensis TaxID=208199 RepID=UPI001883DD8F|nr:SgcJ/EcaC family oxidoreductase [Pseudalkalibacillus hwajinpoensis]MBF0708632.1 SgcJ/EcaC family oxidoreductase [Pseudalkalibacillus hwajinpoensis]
MVGIDEETIKRVYKQLTSSWNERNAQGMANLFTESGESIGFDGSLSKGPEEIATHLAPIFKDHPTAPFVTKVNEIKFIGDNAAILRAIAGMIPPGESDIKPELNTHHTLVLEYRENEWKIVLFQNTPAQFHGRPELVEQMTNELREQL